MPQNDFHQELFNSNQAGYPAKPYDQQDSYDSGFLMLMLLGGILVVFLIFLVVRSIILWYWKINIIVELLERIEKNTGDLVTSVKRFAKEDTNSSTEDLKNGTGTIPNTPNNNGE